MMIWKISQQVNKGYDTYSDAVVIAADPEAARRIHPDGRSRWDDAEDTWISNWVDNAGDSKMRPDDIASGEWSHIKNVVVEMIGVATGEPKASVVCSSFHAG